MKKFLEYIISLKDSASPALRKVGETVGKLKATWTEMGTAIRTGDLGKLAGIAFGAVAALQGLRVAIRAVGSAVRYLNEGMQESMGIERMTRRLQRFSESSEAARATAQALLDTDLDTEWDMGSLIRASTTLRDLSRGLIGSVANVRLMADVAFATEQSLGTVAESVGVLTSYLVSGNEAWSRYALQMVKTRMITPQLVDQLKQMQAAGADNVTMVRALMQELEKRHGGAFDDIRTGLDKVQAAARDATGDMKRELGQTLLPAWSFAWSGMQWAAATAIANTLAAFRGMVQSISAGIGELSGLGLKGWWEKQKEDFWKPETQEALLESMDPAVMFGFKKRKPKTTREDLAGVDASAAGAKREISPEEAAKTEKRIEVLQGEVADLKAKAAERTTPLKERLSSARGELADLAGYPDQGDSEAMLQVQKRRLQLQERIAALEAEQAAVVKHENEVREALVRQIEELKRRNAEAGMTPQQRYAETERRALAAYEKSQTATGTAKLEAEKEFLVLQGDLGDMDRAEIARKESEAKSAADERTKNERAREDAAYGRMAPQERLQQIEREKEIIREQVKTAPQGSLQWEQLRGQWDALERKRQTEQDSIDNDKRAAADRAKLDRDQARSSLADMARQPVRSDIGVETRFDWLRNVQAGKPEDEQIAENTSQMKALLQQIAKAEGVA